MLKIWCTKGTINSTLYLCTLSYIMYVYIMYMYSSWVKQDWDLQKLLSWKENNIFHWENFKITLLISSENLKKNLFQGKSMTKKHLFLYCNLVQVSNFSLFCDHLWLKCKVRVSVQGVESLWGDCSFIPADLGS